MLEPLKLTLTNWPEGAVDELEVPRHPKVPEMGTRVLPFSDVLWLSAEDA